MSLELEVEGLLDPLAALALGEDQVLVLDGPNREGGLFAGVADDVGGEFAVGVDAGVDLLQDQRAGETAAGGGEFLRVQILDQGEGEDSAVAVVGQDGLVAHMDVTAQESLGKGDLLVGEGEDLGLLPVEG